MSSSFWVLWSSGEAPTSQFTSPMILTSRLYLSSSLRVYSNLAIVSIVDSGGLYHVPTRKGFILGLDT